MVIGETLAAETNKCKAYVRGRRRLPLKPPTRGPRTKSDTLYQAILDRTETVPVPRGERKAWISQETWQLIDRRITVRRAPTFDQQQYRWLSRKIKQSLKKDRKTRTIKAGETVKPTSRQGTLRRLGARSKYGITMLETALRNLLGTTLR
jgi:hypothetical protein